MAALGRVWTMPRHEVRAPTHAGAEGQGTDRGGLAGEMGRPPLGGQRGPPNAPSPGGEELVRRAQPVGSAETIVRVGRPIGNSGGRDFFLAVTGGARCADRPPDQGRPRPRPHALGTRGPARSVRNVPGVLPAANVRPPTPRLRPVARHGDGEVSTRSRGDLPGASPRRSRTTVRTPRGHRARSRPPPSGGRATPSHREAGHRRSGRRHESGTPACGSAVLG